MNIIRLWLSIFTLIITGNALKAQEKEEMWRLDFDEALEKAEKENKSILLSFAGSDWCKPCIMLTREVFETDEFKEYASNNLVMVLADFPRLKKNKLSDEQISKNDLLASKFNNDGSFPLVALLSPQGKKVAELGYLQGGPTVYIKKLQTLIKGS